MIPPYISSHDFALAHLLLRECVGVRAISDEEFQRIKTNALNFLPEDQQTMLKDVYPSKNPEDYSNDVRDLSQVILTMFNRKVKQTNEITREDQKKMLLSSCDGAL